LDFLNDAALKQMIDARWKRLAIDPCRMEFSVRWY